MTERGTYQNQEGSEVKTFSVPYALGEIKENISISINTPSKPSKAQIINQAFKFHSQGNISAAAKYYQYFIDQGFKDHIVFSNYGVILRSLGKLKEAELSQRKAIECKPDYAEAHSNLGNILKDLGQLKEAELSLKKAIQLDPNNANDYKNLGNILIQHGKFKEALIKTEKAIELNPNLANAHLNMGVIYKNLGNLKKAEISTRKAVKYKPNLAEAHYNLAVFLSDLGNYEEAEISIRKAIKIKPDFSEAHLHLGKVLLNQGNLKEAELSLRKSIKIDPNLVDNHVMLSEILSEMGEEEKANISQWNAIKINTSSLFFQSYRENSKSINKTAFWVHSCSILNQFLPVIEINPTSFEILVPNNVDNRIILKIHNSLKCKDIRIRSINELIENNLIYEKLVSNRGDDMERIKINGKTSINIPIIKLLGKNNIRFMYTAGKNKYTINSYWNKYYDGILCYGPYHEDRFKIKHKISTSQMGYPRFDKYFKGIFKREYLIKKFKCDPKKKTIVWLPTWTSLSSIDKYHKVIATLRSDHNIVVRPHPSMKKTDPEDYKKLFTVDFTYIDDNDDDNVQLYALADLMLFDFGGPMFGALYINKNFAFLDMNLESKNNFYLGKESSEDYLKSFFPDRIAKLENLNYICNYCLKQPPSNSLMKSLRQEFFNTNYQGNSANKAYELLCSNDWLK